jgi:hypothetical protein
MQPEFPSTHNRIRQIIVIGLIVVGLGLLLGIGGKAMSQINDPSFVYGKQRQQLLWEPDALATTASSSSQNLFPASLEITAPSTNTPGNNNQQQRDRPNTEHKPDHNGGQSNEIASTRSGKKATP